jgi:cell division septation protein DedD
MAARRGTSGLSIGQVLTLSFGFIVASVLIFALGWWVGYDTAQQRHERDRQPVRVPVIPLSALTPIATATRPAAPTAVATKATTPVPSATPTGIAILIRSTPSRTVERVEATVASTRGNWSVQVKATTEALEAVMFARQLRQKGYDAYTTQGPVGNVTWYRVRVGRFPDRAAAEVIERRLKEQEGLEAAYAVKD